MERREFIGTLAFDLLAAPLAAEAQQAEKIPRIASISTTSPGQAPATEAFLQGLRDLGYIERWVTPDAPDGDLLRSRLLAFPN